jgi:PAS domain S-box-containing protein
MSPRRQANILMVDDRPENLLALDAILEPLGERLIHAGSGEEALRILLEEDVALILLDVQMPGMDGFETATFIKARAKTRHIPIIFLTAVGKDQMPEFAGYSAGAVDYLYKPLDSTILQAKVTTFIDLHHKSWELRERGEKLRQAERRQREIELAEMERRSEERYRSLAEAMPQIVWVANADGDVEYFNRRWYEFTGLAEIETRAGGWLTAVHPDDRRRAQEEWESTVRSGEAFETEYRFRRHDGMYRWHIGRALPVESSDGTRSWVGTCTDIDDRVRSERSQRFLVGIGAELSLGPDVSASLQRVADLATEAIADWCSIDLIGEDGSIERCAISHNAAVNQRLAKAITSHTQNEDSLVAGVQRVLTSGKPAYVPDIAELLEAGAGEDHDFLEVAQGLGLHTWISVPLVARGETLGAASFFRSELGGRYTNADLQIVEEFARRAAAALDASRLYEQVQHRARAAQVIESVADGVVMVDASGVVRLWNPAAEAILGIRETEALGRRDTDVVPGWQHVLDSLRRAPGDRRQRQRAQTVPVETAIGEVWLSVSSEVTPDGGTVFAFRDITDERRVDKMKTDFVATISHELRTPLAAIYGAALTLTRPDVTVQQDDRGTLMQMIVDQSQRLADMISELLMVSRLEAGTETVQVEHFAPLPVAEGVVQSARAFAPETIEFVIQAGGDLPHVVGDAGHLSQVLSNLVENAIKYSPEGGTVTVEAREIADRVRFTVRDSGLGIPVSELDRVFEKFYRLDANMARGIGGSGLGLYISRKLVEQMGGAIWAEPTTTRGACFHVEIPMVSDHAHRNGSDAGASAREAERGAVVGTTPAS